MCSHGISRKFRSWAKSEKSLALICNFIYLFIFIFIFIFGFFINFFFFFSRGGGGGQALARNTLKSLRQTSAHIVYYCAEKMPDSHKSKVPYNGEVLWQRSKWNLSKACCFFLAFLQVLNAFHLKTNDWLINAWTLYIKLLHWSFANETR